LFKVVAFAEVTPKITDRCPAAKRVQVVGMVAALLIEIGNIMNEKDKEAMSSETFNLI
jgi:hypothetical protein